MEHGFPIGPPFFDPNIRWTPRPRPGGDPDPGTPPVDTDTPKHRPKKVKKQFVWPRDAKQTDGSWNNWDRLKDVVAGTGPDIWSVLAQNFLKSMLFVGRKG